MLHPAIIGDSSAAWEQILLSPLLCVCVCVWRERVVSTRLKIRPKAVPFIYHVLISLFLPDKNNKLIKGGAKMMTGQHKRATPIK